MKIYQLDIYYTFKDNLYDFCFYHKADNIKNRLVDETILKHLETYAFHNNYNHYHKLVLFDNIIKEINELCFNLKEIYLTIEGLLTDTSDKINH